MVNIGCLKFFEERDARLGGPDLTLASLVTTDDGVCYEIKLCPLRDQTHLQHTHAQRSGELWVEWKGYDQSLNCWVH